MCSRGSRRNRQPLIFILGIAAYGAYQNHKAKKQTKAKKQAEAAALIDQEHGQTVDRNLTSSMQSLDLESDDSEPPSYEDVIADDATVPTEEFHGVNVEANSVSRKTSYDEGSPIDSRWSAIEDIDGLHILGSASTSRSDLMDLASADRTERREARRMERERRREAQRSERQDRRDAEDARRLERRCGRRSACCS